MPCCPEDEKELPPHVKDELDEKSVAYGWRAVCAACGINPDPYEGVSINKLGGRKNIPKDSAQRSLSYY